MQFYPLERLHRLYDGYQRAVTVAGRSLLVLQENSQVYIIANQCPHMDAPLTYATIKQGILRCPLHGIEFKLTTGESVLGAVGPLKRFAPVYSGDQVGVEF